MNRYDAIVIGARCAGSPTAMLLARQGLRVLLVDRATFPSDTLSTHLVHPPGVAALERWGLLDRVAATGCPPIGTYAFDFGPFTLAGSPGTAAAPVAYSPRRTVLDRILVDAAVEAGAEVRTGFTVDELVFDDGRVAGIRGHDRSGSRVTEHAGIVIGADGRHSFVARSVKPDAYDERPPLLTAYYAYWSGMPGDGRFEAYVRPHRAFAAWPTNDGLTLVIGGWPQAEAAAHKDDIEGEMLRTFDQAPAFAERVRAGQRESRFVGTAVPNWFRKPFGPGWALVGDAGYNRDFITAQGISDAFRDAELCTRAIVDAFGHGKDFDAAMRGYQVTRDERVRAMYAFTCDFATLEPPPPEMQQVLFAAHGNQEAMDGFARVNAGVTSPAEYFAEVNVARILAAAPARMAAA